MRCVVVVGLLAACGSVSSKKPDASVGHDSTSGDAPRDGTADGPTCAPKPTSLKARWRGEQNTIDTVSAYNGTAVGNLTYVAGKHGNAFQLDGASYVKIDDGDVLWPTGSFSIELWVNTTHSGTMLEKYECWNSCPPGTTNAFWGLALSNGNPELDVRPDASSSYSTLIDTLHTVNDGQWHQLVGVRDSTNSKLSIYLDGALAVAANLDQVHDGPLTNNDNEVDPILIGAAGTAGQPTFTPTFTGAIDEVAYYTDALTPPQIAAIYNAPQGLCP